MPTNISRPREAGALRWLWNLPCPRRQAAAQVKPEPSSPELHANIIVNILCYFETPDDIHEHVLATDTQELTIIPWIICTEPALTW
jgi:hypothetical protein